MRDIYHLAATRPAAFDPAQDATRQLLRLIDTAYRAPDDNGGPCHCDARKLAAEFDAAEAYIQAHPIHWDEAQCQYVRADGTTLPPPTTRPHSPN